MGVIPNNVIIPYNGTNASIPSGWIRDTRFDGKFLKGATTGLGNTGGSTTHSHTVAHSHTLVSHTHWIDMTQRINGDDHDMGNSGGQVESNHTDRATSNGSTGGTTNSTTVTLDTASNNPSYYDVIFIKASGSKIIPEKGIILSTTPRNGMTYHSSSENKFLKGASTSADAGTTGGSDTHSHTQSHTHTANSHYHSGTFTHTGGGGEDGGNSPALTSKTHSHTYSLQSSTQDLNTDTTTTGSAASVPVYKTILHYVATGNTPTIIGDIAITTETINPRGWITCDGTNGTIDLGTYYVKNTQTSGQTGGANTHSNSLTHAHTGNGTHTHTPNNPTGYSGTSGGHWNSGKRGVTSHQHNMTTIESPTANYSSDTTTSSTDSNEPEYIQVRFIQLNKIETGGAFLYNFI